MMNFTSNFKARRIKKLTVNLPSRMAGGKVCNHRDKNHFLLQTLPLENPQWNMLHQGMDTDYNIWLDLHQPRLHLPKNYTVHYL